MGDHAGEPLPEEVEVTLGNAPSHGRHRRRRVTTVPPVGSDPHPDPEPRRSSGTENDVRLRADKPPHWG